MDVYGTNLKPSDPGDGVDFGQQPPGCGRRLERWQDAVHQGAPGRLLPTAAIAKNAGWGSHRRGEMFVCRFFFYTFLFCLGLNNDSHWIFYKIGVLGLSSPKDWIWKMGDFKIGILGSTSLKRNKSLKIDLTFDV